ncbi:GlxA family transcriptional regulator [Occultella gossypii]|uniref:DJ-1/PfpI family protein n=1 Tax=Occultella gossypii TaxID=2800820 RepID=A0ABS7SDH9_9MICO|nr:DJ-1/PfpI family protein [Occultella gossypii]MBZ2197953.1 DJ-1/PfpI family protein [Occultella gossypii]
MRRRIGIVVFDEMTLLDASGPAEVFHHADLSGERYDLTYVSPAGGTVVSSSGMALSETVAADDVAPVDTVLVAGGARLATGPLDPALLVAVERLADGARRVASVCTGAFVLAELGYLDGRRATTHWRHAHALARRHPRVQVEPDVIHVRDGRYLTSAGISAGMDLALALVEADLGVDVARETARELVMFMQRPGGQTQFSSALQTPPARTPQLRSLTDAVLAEPAAEHTVATMAAMAGVSQRHLHRMFRAELGTPPARWLEQVRVDVARTRILEGHTLTRVAQLCGLGSDETLRRAFARHLGTTPSNYRERFSTTATAGRSR